MWTRPLHDPVAEMFPSYVVKSDGAHLEEELELLGEVFDFDDEFPQPDEKVRPIKFKFSRSLNQGRKLARFPTPTPPSSLLPKFAPIGAALKSRATTRNLSMVPFAIPFAPGP